MTDERAEQIYRVLTGRRFQVFYGDVDMNDNAPLSRHICGDTGCLTKAQILEVIKDMFKNA